VDGFGWNEQLDHQSLRGVPKVAILIAEKRTLLPVVVDPALPSMLLDMSDEGRFVGVAVQLEYRPRVWRLAREDVPGDSVSIAPIRFGYELRYYIQVRVARSDLSVNEHA
jgi:hypothetical protein